MADVVPNEELRALLLRMYALWEAKDIEGLADLVSRQPMVLLAGTDPEESMTGADAVNVFAEQIRLMPPWTVKRCEPRAHSSGNVGWVSDELQVAVGDLFEFHARIAATLVIEDGHWRIIQWHMSAPRSSGDVLPKSIDRVRRFVRGVEPERPAAVPPDGTVTIVFTDIESSSALLERLGDTEFMHVLAWHDRIVRDTVAQHDGYVVEAEGDGFMVAFASAASALRSCLVRHR